MTRKNMFGDGTGIFGKGEEESSDIEYTTPEEKLVDLELANKLIEHYISERNKGRLSLFWKIEDFKSEVNTLLSILKDAEGKFKSQPLIDSLTSLLKEESDGPGFSRTMYLTAVVQTLFNLNQGNEFVIDIRDWSEGEYDVSHHLKSGLNKPIILNLYGNFYSSCYRASYCNFTFYDENGGCGLRAEKCTFSMMPNAEITYLGYSSYGNVWRKLKEDGKWEIIHQNLGDVKNDKKTV